LNNRVNQKCLELVKNAVFQRNLKYLLFLMNAFTLEHFLKKHSGSLVSNCKLVDDTKGGKHYLCDVYLKNLKFAINKKVVEEFDKNPFDKKFDLDNNKTLDFTEFSVYKKVLPSPLIEGVTNAEY
jgi:hypothetical protein